jgi:hypothetical protein
MNLLREAVIHRPGWSVGSGREAVESARYAEERQPGSVKPSSITAEACIAGPQTKRSNEFEI